jgi:LL-diaminopimelate aminotransferase
MQTAKRLEGIGEYYFSQKLREIDQLNKEGRQIISLGIGSPDLPPHPDVIQVLQEESAHPNVHAYQSYKGSPILRKAISEWYLQWYGVDLNPDTEILPLIGSKEGIMHICMTYLNEGDKALIFPIRVIQPITVRFVWQVQVHWSIICDRKTNGILI